MGDSDSGTCWKLYGVENRHGPHAGLVLPPHLLTRGRPRGRSTRATGPTSDWNSPGPLQQPFPGALLCTLQGPAQKAPPQQELLTSATRTLPHLEPARWACVKNSASAPDRLPRFSAPHSFSHPSPGPYCCVLGVGPSLFLFSASPQILPLKNGAWGPFSTRFLRVSIHPPPPTVPTPGPGPCCAE